MNWYDGIAKGYDELRGDEQRRKFAVFDDYIDEDMRILDVGFGTGLSDEYFDAQIVGVEPSKGMLDEYNGDAKTYQAKAEEIGEIFQPDSFDAVLCVSSAHHFAEPRKVIKDLDEVLRDDSYLFLTVFEDQCDDILSALEDEFDNFYTTAVNRDRVVIAKS